MKIEQKFVTGQKGLGRLLFMSDLHYNHENSIKHSNRPFENITQMNEWIKKKLQEVKPEDTLFDLGDLFWRVEWNEARSIINSINTKNIYKLIGNHDSSGLYYGKNNNISNCFACVADILDITVVVPNIDTYHLVLSHYPILSWKNSRYGSLMIHGHCHGNIDDNQNKSPYLRLDIGVDSEFTLSLEKKYGEKQLFVDFFDIIEFLKEKTNNQDFCTYALNNYGTDKVIKSV